MKLIAKFKNGNSPSFESYTFNNSPYPLTGYVVETYTKNKAISEEQNPTLNNGVSSQEVKDNIVTRRESLTNRSDKKGNVSRLQNQLYNIGAFGNLDYKTAVDGVMGTLTKDALVKAAEMGYAYNKTSGELTKEPVKEESKIQEKSNLIERVKGFSFNNPAVEMVSDLASASINRAGKAILGEDTTLIRRSDVTSLPQSQINILRDMIKQHGGEPKGGFSSSDWRDYQGTYTGGNRSLVNRMATPSGKLEHTLGQFNWYTNDDGDIIVTDTYDWNTGEGTPNNGMYSKVRTFMGKYGSKDTDPDQWKRHYKINIGKLS